MTMNLGGYCQGMTNSTFPVGGSIVQNIWFEVYLVLWAVCYHCSVLLLVYGYIHLSNFLTSFVCVQNLEEKHALRVQLELAVEDLWAQFQQALRNYQETTEERKKAFEELKAKDERSAKEIETQMRKLQRLTVMAVVWYCSDGDEKERETLTHLPLDKMAAISQTIFPATVSWMKSFTLWLKIHWSLFLRVQLTIIQHWFR